MAPLDFVPPHDTAVVDADTLAVLRELQKKVLWLATWTIHHANHGRPHPDGLKVGGHQASCASVVSLMTALYFHTLRPEDRVAVKPHASPVFHAIQYLFDHQMRDKLEAFRAFGGAQSYPSRTKDADDVDISTGSVGLGPGMTVFAALVQDYVRHHFGAPRDRVGRMVAIVGDAELDEGNVYEALMEGWKHNLRNCWWIVDYNRQSLDGIVSDRLFRWIDRTFRATGWNVITLKYGKLMRQAFARPGGKALKRWINDCPNALYSALTFQGGAAWRQQLTRDLGHDKDAVALIAAYDDRALQELMTNLGGHCLETILEAFASVKDDTSTCFIAYTIKGHGLPLAGHKDNHAGILTPDQLAGFKRDLGIADGEEWDPFAGLAVAPEQVRDFLARVPFNAGGPRRRTAPEIPVPTRLTLPTAARTSTQEAFGRLLNEIGRTHDDFAKRIVTTSPDVTVSTNLGAWVNRRGLFAQQRQDDVFHMRKVASHQKWEAGEAGQHVELGIAENSLFLLLAAFGLSHELFGERVLPIGTLYDPFIARGLDALSYACYQDARFILVATPSGITLAPEGGAHQSVGTPMIGIGQPGITYFEPAYADELAVILRFAFAHIQAPDGGSVYLRLSTRPIDQPKRDMTDALVDEVLAGGYWQARPAGKRARTLAGAIVYCGAVAPEAAAAFKTLAADRRDIGLLAVTSPGRLFEGWRRDGARSHAARLLSALKPGAPLVTVLDGHPGALAWLGAVGGHRVVPLGVDDFGQCGTIGDLYRHYRIDAEAIVAAFAKA
jgi:pyruvate dehydrogenase E1 component